MFTKEDLKNIIEEEVELLVKEVYTKVHLSPIPTDQIKDRFQAIINSAGVSFEEIFLIFQKAWEESKNLHSRDPIEEKKEDLRTWFKRKGEKGPKGGWVDCNAPDGKGGYKSCSPGSGEKRKRYPACRPTPARCKDPGKGTKWGKKSSKRKKK